MLLELLSNLDPAYHITFYRNKHISDIIVSVTKYNVYRINKVFRPEQWNNPEEMLCRIIDELIWKTDQVVMQIPEAENPVHTT